MNFTKDQERAYKAYGHNVLVSAGAGSGKTQVLSERVRYLVQEHGYKIDEFLILTFTNLAAGEMKERIRKKLKGINSEEADKVDNAYISTFDSFALNIVKKYYYYLNVSQDISMIDSNALNVFVYNKIDEILERKYLHDDVLSKLSLVMNNKDDKGLKGLIFNVYLKASSATDEEEYFNNLLLNHNNKSLMKCLKEYEDILDECVNKLIEFSSFFESHPKFGQKYQAVLQPYLEATTLDEKVSAIKAIPSRGFPSFSKNMEDEELKKYISFYKDKLKDAVKYFDNSQSLYDELKDQKEFTSLIIDIVKEILLALRKYKDSIQSYTFSDIAKMAIDLFKQNEVVRSEMKSKFKTIMIDEYQDTSQIQEDFINYISDNNVYMVGDVKQSIYRFRGAVPTLFTKKFNSYKAGIGGELICLSDNFRSRGEVLDDINVLFSDIMTDELGGANYKLDHIIGKGNKEYELNKGNNQNYSSEIYYFKKDDYSENEKEARLVVQDIINKINSGYQVVDYKNDKQYLRNAKFSDFCILADRGESFSTYQKIFNEYGVPLFIIDNVDISKSPLIFVIKNILVLTKCLMEKDFTSGIFNHAFISILRSYLFEMTDEEIYHIISNKTAEETMLITRLKELYERYSKNGPYTYIYNVVRDFKFYDKLIKIGDIRMYEKYLDSFLQTFKGLNDLGYTIDNYIEYFDLITEKELKIDIPSSTTEYDAVKLMNIFKSKGLEFSVVYCVGMNRSFNRTEYNPHFILSNKHGIIYPTRKHEKSIIFYLNKNEDLLDDISEKIRLFYVQVTRAKEKLIYLWPEKFKPTPLIKTNKLLNLLAGSFNNVKVVEKELMDISLNPLFVNQDEVQLTYSDIKIEDEIIELKRASKTLSFDSQKEVLEYGEKLHLYLEIIDFNNPDLSIISSPRERNVISKFINSDLIKNLENARYYKEYEFIDKINNTRGIIDLLVVHEKGVLIIDYKLKNIDDEAYKKQLRTYYNFVASHFNKVPECYLYSILDGVYNKVEIE